MSVTSYGALVRDVAGECSSEHVVKKYRDLRNGKRFLQSTDVVRKIDDDPITLNSLAESAKVVKHDGKCYDAAALARWYREHNTLPHNRATGTLSAKDLHVIGILPLFHFIRHNDSERFKFELAHMYDDMYLDKKFTIRDLETVDMQIFKILDSALSLYDNGDYVLDASTVGIMIAIHYNRHSIRNILLDTFVPFEKINLNSAKQIMAMEIIGLRSFSSLGSLVAVHTSVDILKKYNFIDSYSFMIFLYYFSINDDKVPFIQAKKLFDNIWIRGLKDDDRNSVFTQLYLYKKIEEVFRGDNFIWNTKCNNIVDNYFGTICSLVELDNDLVNLWIRKFTESDVDVFERIKKVIRFAAERGWTLLILDIILLYDGDRKNTLVTLAMELLDVRSHPDLCRIIAAQKSS